MAKVLPPPMERCCMGSVVGPGHHCESRAVEGELWCAGCISMLADGPGCTCGPCQTKCGPDCPLCRVEA